jgi:hypothetical protein
MLVECPAGGECGAMLSEFTGVCTRSPIARWLAVKLEKRECLNHRNSNLAGQESMTSPGEEDAMCLHPELIKLELSEVDPCGLFDSHTRLNTDDPYHSVILGDYIAY